MRITRSVALALMLCAVSVFAAAENTVSNTNLLQNSTFNLGPFGPSTNMASAGSGWGWFSAALDWTVWSNGPGVLISDVLPTMDPNGTGNMIHVMATADGAGLVQTFGAQNSGPDLVHFSVSVYVLNGCVGAGVGNGGDTSLSAATCQQNRWIRLQGRNSVSPANEFIIYSFSGGAEWYAEDASVRMLCRRCVRGRDNDESDSCQR